MNSINNPATKLIALLFLVKKPITFWLQFVDIAENIKRGNAKPIPNERKLRIFDAAFVTRADFANKAAINAGLHGTTIAPKKNP